MKYEAQKKSKYQKTAMEEKLSRLSTVIKATIIFPILRDDQVGKHTIPNKIPGQQTPNKEIFLFVVIMGWVKICTQERKMIK